MLASPMLASPMLASPMLASPMLASPMFVSPMLASLQKLCGSLRYQKNEKKGGDGCLKIATNKLIFLKNLLVYHYVLQIYQLTHALLHQLQTVLYAVLDSAL